MSLPGIKRLAIGAMTYSDPLTMALLEVSRSDATADEVRAALPRVFQCASGLSAALRALEDKAPNSATAGFERALIAREMT